MSIKSFSIRAGNGLVRDAGSPKFGGIFPWIDIQVRFDIVGANAQGRYRSVVSYGTKSGGGIVSILVDNHHGHEIVFQVRVG